jgi:hypothetical protein
LRSLALFCAASSVGNTVFIRPSTCKPKPSVITRSARVMLRGCSSSGIVRGFSWQLLGLPLPHLITASSIEEQRLSRSFPGRSIFDLVSVPNGHQTSSMQSRFFPDSGRWSSDCEDPNCYSDRMLWNVSRSNVCFCPLRLERQVPRARSRPDGLGIRPDQSECHHSLQSAEEDGARSVTGRA